MTATDAEIGPRGTSSWSRTRTVSARERTAMIVVAIAYTAARLVPMIHATTSSVTDSFNYYASSRNSILSRELWAGPRPVLYPLLAKAFGRSDNLLFAFQAIVALLAWLALAWLISTRVHHRVVAAVAAVAVLLFSLSIDVVVWDRVLVTESLSISIAVVLLVLGVLVGEAPSRGRVLSFSLIALAWVLLRDSNAYVVLCVAVVFAVGAARVPRERAFFAVVAVALAGAFLVGSVSSNVGKRWAGPLKDVITVRALTYPDRTDYLFEHGLPISRVDAGKIAGFCIVRHPPLSVCKLYNNAQLYRWIQHHGRATYSSWLTSHPRTALADPVRHADDMLGTRVQVDLFTHYRFAPAQWGERIFFVRTMWALLVESLLGFGLALWALWRLRSPLAWAVVTGFLTTYPHLFVVWTFAGLETERHALVASVILRLSIVLAVAVAADAALTTRVAAPEAEPLSPAPV